MKKSILIIDDSGTSLLLLEWVMQNAGYEAVIAESVKQGIACIEKNKPDLILLDLQMPNISGFDFLKMKDELKIQDVPIIIISAQDTVENIKLTKELGAVDFVPKPVKTNILVEKVKKILH